MSDLRVNNKFIPLDTMPVQSSGYSGTMERFEQILVEKLGLSPNKLSDTIKSQVDNVGNNYIVQGESDLIDVNTYSGDSIAKINNYLKGTPMANMGSAFKAAEGQYGINAFFLASLAVLESNYGKSPIARDKKNLFGFQAYDSDPYNSARKFDSFEEGVVHVADYLKENYLTKGGKYFNGTTTDDIGKNYATSPTWATKVNKIMQEMSR